MDDIDREINKVKIGKKDEPLTGWDHIRKPVETHLPPMRAKGVDDKYNWLLSKYKGSSKQKKRAWFGWTIVLLIVLLILLTKFMRYW